jgi:TRAP-type C4-dicarboxylate transport system substrate-binding protein
MDAAAKAEERGWQASMAETAEKTKLLEENGMTVSKPSDQLKAGLQEIGEKMTADWVEAAGPEGKEIVEALE